MKLDEIITAAKSIGNKGTLFSQLTELQQQAALWVGEFFPAHMVGDRPKYSRTAKQATLAPSYMYFRHNAAATPHTLKGFDRDTFQVYMDTTLPTQLEEVTWKEAVAAFPSWKVPRKEGKYDHLPYLLPVLETIAPNHPEVAGALAKLAVYINRDDYAMPENFKAIWSVIHIHSDTAKTIAEALGQTQAIKTILNFQPEKVVVGQTEVEGETVDVRRFKLPRANMSREYKGSYLANYITQALLGNYLKAPE